MLPNERDALIKYLEFRLVGLVDSVQDDIDSLLEQRLLEEAYDILTDIEDSFIINELTKKGSSSIPRS